MNVYPHLLWRTTAELARWIDRNCVHCRFRRGNTTDGNYKICCDIPVNLLRYHLVKIPMKNYELEMVFGAQPLDANSSPANPPHFCKSKKDTRGRPGRQTTS